MIHSKQFVMRSFLVLIVATMAASAQQRENNGPEGDSIPWGDADRLVAMALENNPDVLVAEAKLREAEAELNRVRLQVTQDVLAIRNQREVQVLAVDTAAGRLERVQKLHQAANVSDNEVRESQLGLINERGQLADLHAKARYILGMGGRKAKFTQATEERSTKAERQGDALIPRRIVPLPADVSRVMSLRQVAPIQGKMRLGEIVAAMKAVIGDEVHISVDPAISDTSYTVDLPPVSMAQALKALSDISYGNLVAVYREYGFYLTTSANAMRLAGPTIPEGALIDPRFDVPAPTSTGGR